MLRTQFEPCQALGKNLEGIIEMIVILKRIFKCGLGYKSTKKNENEEYNGEFAQSIITLVLVAPYM